MREGSIWGLREFILGCLVMVFLGAQAGCTADRSSTQAAHFPGVMSNGANILPRSSAAKSATRFARPSVKVKDYGSLVSTW